MSQSLFYVSHNGEQMGPWDLDTILSKVRSNEMAMSDYIFDEKSQDWVLLMDNAEFAKHFSPAKSQAKKPSAKVVTPEQTAPTDPMMAEWFVLKGENKFGPFAYKDVIRMLQEKVVFEFDFAWMSGMATWKRVADIDAFKADHVKKLQNNLMPEISDVFFRRHHRRVKYGGTILVHDNQQVWKGHGIEISAGGAGVVIENALITPGQVLFLHFKPGDGVPPFNAICEVVSKQYVEGVKSPSTSIRYGLRFKSISNSAQKFLQEFSRRGETAGAA
jgi:hypothetical protein